MSVFGQVLELSAFLCGVLPRIQAEVGNKVPKDGPTYHVDPGFNEALNPRAQSRMAVGFPSSPMAGVCCFRSRPLKS